MPINPCLRDALLFLLLVLTSASALAQPAQDSELTQPRPGARYYGPECELAADLLEAGTHREIAWGAWWAAECGLTALAPTITRRLPGYNPYQGPYAPGPSEAGARDDCEACVGRALASALIRLRIPLSEEQLVPLLPLYPLEVTILALRDGPAGLPMLWRIRERQHGPLWHIATDALSEARAPGIAIALLRELKPSHDIYVNDHGTYIPGGSMGSIISGISTFTVPSDYPPIEVYRLGGEDTRCEGPLPGTHAYWSLCATTWQPGRQVEWRSGSATMESDDDRIGYLARLAVVNHATTKVAFQPSTALRWQGEAILRNEIHRALDLQRQRIRNLATRLRNAALLDDENVEWVVQVRILDQRSNPHPPLPQLPPFSISLGRTLHATPDLKAANHDGTGPGLHQFPRRRPRHPATGAFPLCERRASDSQ